MRPPSSRLVLAAASLLLGQAAVADPATANPWPETGGWGQAWDETEDATALPQQPLGQPVSPGAAPPARAPAAAAMPPGERLLVPLPTAAPRIAATQNAPVRIDPAFGQSWPESGGWGQAWDETEDAPAAPAANRYPPIRAAAAQPAAAFGGPQQPLGAPRAVQSERPRRAAADKPLHMGPRPGTPIKSGDEPVRLTADQIVHDRELGIVTAVGKVEVQQAGRTMVAENVTYNLKQDIVAASGNVTLIEPSGDVLFAEYFELTGDFKNGVAQEIRVLLSDRSRMAAATAERIGGDRTDFRNATYTACEPCASDPNRPPIWQTKAEQVTHNQADRTIEYRNAWIEMAGVPVLYTPYLSHPDPSVKRKSGFLTPAAGMNSALGASITTPYFWTISDNEDLTFSPRFLFPKSAVTETTTVDTVDQATSSVLKRVVLAGQHRWVGSMGEAKTIGSLTADKNSGELRGHLDAKGRFDLDQTWRAGYQFQHLSDDTYAPIYGARFEGDRPWLTNRPYLEGFGRRSYAMAEAFSFQGQRVIDDPGQSPLVRPHMVYSHVGPPGWRGSYWTMDSDLLSYQRSEGTDASRLSVQSGWHLPWTTRNGEVYTLSASMRGDGYRADDLSTTAPGASPSATTGRAVPQVSVNWRYPLVSTTGLNQILQPMAMVAASPNGGNPAKLPNEDSLGFELDETNVLRPTRIVGLDRVEGGLRGGYGLRWTAYPRTGGSILAQAGQGWRAHADNETFTRNSGFTENFSDYVGRLDISPAANFAFGSRVRLDKDSWSVRRNEETISIGPAPLQAAVSYVMVEKPDAGAGPVFGRRQYLTYSVSSTLSQHWRVLGTASHDLTGDGGPLGWAVQTAYNDECFAVVTNLRRFFGSGRDDLLSGYELTLNLVFKTLGDVPFNVF